MEVNDEHDPETTEEDQEDDEEEEIVMPKVKSKKRTNINSELGEYWSTPTTDRRDRKGKRKEYASYAYAYTMAASAPNVP